MLLIKDLYKSFVIIKVLIGFHYELNAVIYGLFGANGPGKSTLLY